MVDNNYAFKLASRQHFQCPQHKGTVKTEGDGYASYLVLIIAYGIHTMKYCFSTISMV